MPKVIKKRIDRPAARPEEQVRTFMADTAERLERNLRRVAIAAGAALVVVILLVGYFAYGSARKSRAEELFYAGYKQYHGLYEGRPAAGAERFEGALESFGKSYEVRKSPVTLLYVANSYYALGRYDEAVAKLDELTRTFPQDELAVPLALYKKAMALLKAGRAEEALGAFEALYNSGARSLKDMALMESARMLEDLGRPEEAARKYELILSEYPDSPFAEEARVRAGKDGRRPKEEGARQEEG